MAWHKTRSLQGERDGKKRRTAAQVHDSFNSKMQCQIKYFFKCFTLWYLFLPNWGLFVSNSSIGTQQFNNHTSRVYTVSFTSSMLKHRKSSFFFILHKLKLNSLHTNLAVKNLSAVSRHPSGPLISVFREKCKKDVLFFCWKPSHYEGNQNPQHLLSSGETLFMRRFKTLASAWKCPEMPKWSICWQYTGLPCFLFRRQSVTSAPPSSRDSLAQIQERSSSSGTCCCAWKST